MNGLRTFEAAARLGSHSRAGDELHVTYSAVSHQIKRLEAWFGTPLFKRQGTGVALTRTGEALSAYLTPAFTGMADVSAKLRADGGGRSLAVGCIPSIASRWLVPRIARFTARQPDISLQLLYALATDRPALGSLDVLITLGQDPAPGLRNRPLFSRASKPVASPHYIARRGGLRTPAAIAAADLLHDETPEAWRDWMAAAGLAPCGPLPGPVFQDFNMLATAMIAGHGVALCPVEVFRDELRRGDLVVLSDIAVKSEGGYYMISAGAPSPAVAAFTAWFLAETRADAD
jgi:DNA-binding transcriptional LysR family regulator